MSEIKIFVTHISNKEDASINNGLMVDVVAGADYQTKPLPDGWVPDNTRDHISKKNKSYCELTTQYWAWKNVEADYYGFCHYRRFLSLSDKKYKSNDPGHRGQVYVKVLNDTTAHLYHLDDDQSAQKFIERYDCILPQKQNVSQLPTPIGRQRSVYKHFESHNRLFMNGTDLKTLLSVISELYPDYSNDAKEFLASSYFWGYNCFILKKEYFFQLCEFEFSILEEMEKRIDTSLYNQQMARMPGFMGEIVSCIFFYHLIKHTQTLKVAEVQLLYFEKTNQTANPVHSAGAVPIVFHIDKVPPFLFLVTLDSFLKQTATDQLYDVIILHWNIPSNFIMHFNKMIVKYENINATYIDYSDIEYTLMEMNLYVPDSRVLLPWILPRYDNVLCFSWNTIFNIEPSSIKILDIKDNWIAGNKDILMIGTANDVFDDYKAYLIQKLGIKNVESLIDYRSFYMNLSAIRKVLNPNEISSILKQCKKNLTVSEELNIIVQNYVLFYPRRLSYYHTEDQNEIRLMKQAPLYLYNAFNSSRDKIPVIHYNPDCLWNFDGSEFNTSYWNATKKLSLYHLFLEHYAHVVCSATINTSPNKPFYRKVLGGIKCIKDHGLAYTIKYVLRNKINF